MTISERAPVDAWATAARLLVRWLEDNERVDTLLDSLPPTLGRTERRRCQHLLFGVVRHLGRIEAALKVLVTRPTRARLRAVLLIAGFELLEGGPDGHVARVVHHAVEQAKRLTSEGEAKLVNAVVRKLAPVLEHTPVLGPLVPAADLAVVFSHPEWLVSRWLGQWGAQSTRALLEWNQRPGPVYARWRLKTRTPGPEEQVFLVPTAWPEFYEVTPGHWPAIEALIAAGTIFLQDPATRPAVALLAPRAGETVLDTCASPGGKSLLIADAMGAGKLIAMDLPGPRIARLRENLSRIQGVETAVLEADLLTVEPRHFRERGLPTEYAALLVDAPCSNTGVMRHRVDVKWRLQPADFGKHARQQTALLEAAARLIAPGGRLVYSTCSLDVEENEQVVQAFLGSRAGAAFRLERSEIRLPWIAGHDGAAAFRLERVEKV